MERDFRGVRPPFMTFEREMELLSAKQVHSPSREETNYRVQIQHCSALPPTQPSGASSARRHCSARRLGGGVGRAASCIPCRLVRGKRLAWWPADTNADRCRITAERVNGKPRSSSASRET